MYRILSTILFIHTLQIWHSAAQTEDCKCGLANRKGKVAGGDETEVNEYPWMVFLSFKRNNRTYDCGGSLINNQWILTAAHCRGTDGRLVSLGDHELYTPNETDSTFVRIVKRIDHPLYDPVASNDPYDFSLLKIEPSVDFEKQPNIRPICLPTDDAKNYKNYSAIVSGWGYRTPTGERIPTLQEADVQIIPSDQCMNILENSTQIEDFHICAGDLDGNRGVCAGDSGGPLITSGSGDGVTPGQNYEIIGVASFVRSPDGFIPCSVGKFFSAVFGRVTSILDWIKNNTRGSNTCPRVTLTELC